MKIEKKIIQNPPYTVYGHTVLTPSFSVIMKIEGLRKMLEGLDSEDSFQIEVFENKQPEYTIIKK